MGQAVVVEKLFSWPGIGSLLVDSVLQRDIPAVQGSILVVVLFFLAINMLIDVLYGVIDPRIRLRHEARQPVSSSAGRCSRLRSSSACSRPGWRIPIPSWMPT